MKLDWESLFGDAPVGLSGLHVSRAGDFYWPAPSGAAVNYYPPSAPALTAGQIRARVKTGEVRVVK